MYSAAEMASATTTAGITSQPMLRRYSFVACAACRQLPEPAQTMSGTRATRQANAKTGLRKVST